MAYSSQLIISLILTWSGGRPFWTFSQGWKSNRIWFLYPNCLKSEMHRRELQCGRIFQWIRRTCNDHNIEPIAMLEKGTNLIKKRQLHLQYWITQCTEVRFASCLSGGFITAIVVNPPERQLAKRTSVQCNAVR